MNTACSVHPFVREHYMFCSLFCLWTMHALFIISSVNTAYFRTCLPWSCPPRSFREGLDFRPLSGIGILLQDFHHSPALNISPHCIGRGRRSQGCSPDQGMRRRCEAGLHRPDPLWWCPPGPLGPGYIQCSSSRAYSWQGYLHTNWGRSGGEDLSCPGSCYLGRRHGDRLEKVATCCVPYLPKRPAVPQCRPRKGHAHLASRPFSLPLGA